MFIFSQTQPILNHSLNLYTIYPIVAGTLGLAAAYRPSARASKVILHTRPQSAYCVFTGGLRDKFMYLIRTMKLETFMGPLDELISNDLIPSLLGGKFFYV